MQNLFGKKTRNIPIPTSHPRATMKSMRKRGIFCVSTSLQGWWPLATAEKQNVGNPCKIYENFRIVIMMGCFLEALSNFFSLRFGEVFWISQSSWDVSTLSTQHSQRKHFPILCPSTKEIIACCMLKHEHLEPFDGLGGLSSHAVILSESPGCLATTFYGSPTSSLTGHGVMMWTEGRNDAVATP